MFSTVTRGLPLRAAGAREGGVGGTASAYEGGDGGGAGGVGSHGGAGASEAGRDGPVPPEPAAGEPPPGAAAEPGRRRVGQVGCGTLPVLHTFYKCDATPDIRL